MLYTYIGTVSEKTGSRCCVELTLQLLELLETISSKDLDAHHMMVFLAAESEAWLASVPSLVPQVDTIHRMEL